MAKNCINPICKKEIPSSATFCSYCGAQQVEDIQLSEEEKLRKEISEMQKTIALLKKALADAQQNNDSSVENLQTIANLQKKLTEVEGKEKKTTEKNTMPNPKPKKNWIWFLLSGLFLILIDVVFVFVKMQNDNSDNGSTKWEQLVIDSVAAERKQPVIDSVAAERKQPIIDSIAAEVFIDREKIKKIIRNYSQYTVENNFQGFRKLYAPTVKRYHDAYNKDKECIIGHHERYDKKYGVYGKHSSIRWETLSIKPENDILKITYVEDYSIDSDKPEIYKHFVLEKHLELNTNYQIVSVYDVQKSRSK
jgi:ribosome-binding ATPase YchF (GTP1/OBG family)